MTEQEKQKWREAVEFDVRNSTGRDFFVSSVYGAAHGEWQERTGGVKVFGYWVGNQDAKQFVKTGVGSTWAEALEQALTFAEWKK